MTDRHAAYLVVLENDIREDDAETTISALRQIKGVIDVQPVAGEKIIGGNVAVEIARSREGARWHGRLLKFLVEREKES
jgi:hypothetical protein